MTIGTLELFIVFIIPVPTTRTARAPVVPEKFFTPSPSTRHYT